MSPYELHGCIYSVSWKAYRPLRQPRTLHYPRTTTTNQRTIPREEFRKETVLTPVCKGMITGLGWRGYLFALTAVVEAAKEANP